MCQESGASHKNIEYVQASNCTRKKRHAYSKKRFPACIKNRDAAMMWVQFPDFDIFV
jgi:hypothetical protein